MNLKRGQTLDKRRTTLRNKDLSFSNPKGQSSNFLTEDSRIDLKNSHEKGIQPAFGFPMMNFENEKKGGNKWQTLTSSVIEKKHEPIIPI